MRVMRFLQSMCLSSFRAPIGWGDPERRDRSPGQRGRFSEDQEQDCSCSVKGEAGNPGGKPKPVGLELLSAAAERGITLKPSPTEMG